MLASIQRWLARFDLVVIAGLFLALMPVLHVQRTTDFIVFCLYVLSFDLIYGHMGRLSFGHMLYLGAGAYGAALCSVHLSANPIVALAASVILAGAVGLLLGPLVDDLRLGGADLGGPEQVQDPGDDDHHEDAQGGGGITGEPPDQRRDGEDGVDSTEDADVLHRSLLIVSVLPD